MRAVLFPVRRGGAERRRRVGISARFGELRRADRMVAAGGNVSKPCQHTRIAMVVQRATSRRFVARVSRSNPGMLDHGTGVLGSAAAW